MVSIYRDLLAPTVGGSKASASPHSAIGAGRQPKLTGLEILIRMHIVLSHCSLRTLLTTLGFVTVDGKPAIDRVTKSDIEEYVRRGCGVCESTKLKRPPFHRLADPTPIPVGKYWVFDSLALRVRSREYGYEHIMRFVNRVHVPLKLKRSYGLLDLTSSSIEGSIQKLRAYVRPYHGEIHVTKCDSLPAQKSRSMHEFADDSSIYMSYSPPYCHEGVGDVEVTFMHDVPSSNALLLGSGSNSNESDFYTAFLTNEAASNHRVQESESPASFFFGAEQRPYGCMLIYGSPV
eukprot:5683454-Prymnesium_polylepis.1